jgi:hypothetical protein
LRAGSTVQAPIVRLSERYFAQAHPTLDSQIKKPAGQSKITEEERVRAGCFEPLDAIPYE